MLIYSDILVTGRLVSWTSGPLYSDVDISDTSSQDSSNLLFIDGCKVQKFCSVLDIKIPSTATFCHNALPSILQPKLWSTLHNSVEHRFLAPVP